MASRQIVTSILKKLAVSILKPEGIEIGLSVTIDWQLGFGQPPE
jgi:hypothetical protein